MAMKEKRMVEIAAVPDIFASGLGRVEMLPGGMVRRIYYADQQPLHDTNAPHERVVVARIVTSIEAVPPAMMMMILAVGNGECGLPDILSKRIN